MSDNNVEHRINQLIAEMSDCREDERNAQNQILEVVSVAGTILGILFGAFYLGKNPVGGMDDTYARIMYFLSLLVFCIAFSYILVLGMNSCLRYYYIQNLEDRLHDLIPKAPDDEDRNIFLSWTSYSAPVITKNPKHITSIHTALHYVCYAVAVVGVTLFSLGMVVVLFCQIENKTELEYFLLITVAVFMMGAIVFYVYFATSAKRVSQFAWDTAHENWDFRYKNEIEKMYKKRKSFRRILKYLIYPKIRDVQKPVLIIGGYVCGILLFDIGRVVMIAIQVGVVIQEWPFFLKMRNFINLIANFIQIMDIPKLVIVLLVFELLAYQARYQINDIRGLKEDKEISSKKGLPIEGVDNPGHVIKISFMVAIFKIILGIIITICFGGEVRLILLVSLGILFLSTIIYEWFRARKITKGVFISVGMGYPLRFFLGVFTAVMPEKWMFLKPQFIFTVIALWAYGSFSSILSWCNQVSNHMQKVKKEEGQFREKYEKHYFQDIQNIIKTRYEDAENCPINGRVMPLRENCKLFDSWNIAFGISLVSMVCIAALGEISEILLVLEFMVLVFFVLAGCFYRKTKLFFIVIGWILIVMKAVLSVFSYKLLKWYLVLSFMQLVITGTYFVLCYRPQLPKANWKNMIQKCRKKVLGTYADEIIERET